MTIKLLVVDDSALMRRSIRQAFEAEPDFTVYHAHDGEDALRQIAALSPDMVTLDINMPVMDGLTCLSHIMTESPCPVVMVSSLTEKGALATFEALEMGAVDYVPKPDGTVSLRMKEVVPLLVQKVRAAAGAQLQGSALRRVRTARARRACQRPIAAATHVPGVVVVGVSTGGPKVLEEFISELPGDFPLPVVIAQHMPESFTRVFAERLDGCSAVTVKEADRAEPLRPGCVYIGKGGADVVIERRLGRLAVAPIGEDASPWHPSVSRLVRSAMTVVPPQQIIGVQLTGMGNDGAAELAELNRRGGYTIAQSAESCVVFGMPRELIELGGASTVLNADAIAQHLTDRAALLHQRLFAAG